MNYIHRFLVYSSLVAGLCIYYGCKSSPAKTPVAVESGLLTTVLVHDTAQENTFKRIISHNPQTFETCNVYKNADTTSEVLETLKPFSSFKQFTGVEIALPDTIPANGDIPEQYSTYTVVWAEVVTLNGTKGYVNPDKVANWTYENPGLNVRYLIGNYLKGKKRDWTTRFAKLDLSTGKIISLVECAASSSEYEPYVNEIKNLPLKNVQAALRLYTHGDFCGGGDNSIIMADTKNGLVLIPSSNNFYDDGGGISGSTTYFPAVNQKGELKLYADADPKNANADPKSVNYPTDTKIPLSELIIEKGEDGSYATNDDGEIVNGKDGKEKLETLVKTTVYYRWDGNKITKIAEKKLKVK